jgi:hypothetical protein
MELPDGGKYQPSKYQKELLKAFNKFFDFASQVSSEAERKILVINGDLVDGNHHNTVSLASNNVEVQEADAIKLLMPQANKFDRVYVVRGTEAHTQPGAQSDERIAKALAAIPDDNGQSSRWQLWLDVDGVVFNIAHHIGTTSSAAYESSAVMREMVAALVEAGQWGQRLPDVLIRSHRHRFIEVSIPSARGRIIAAVTPGWQLRTPFVERIDRMRMPHIGGVVCRVEDKRCQVLEKIYPIRNGHPEKI